MALRLRRDVQKASYYVWFLGAEEAKGLRGINIINPVLPYLIERSLKQEPLKVTLQVSHKGIKILQESSKHFIPHSAITSSIQRDDIVACVLLLYNPATKCPIHVHAYRCDSETTAEALHQQLQVLINRPDNQKRFAELESRLGLTQSTSSLPSSKQKRIPGRFENRFISSLGSDTGISTRESEGSEEHSMSPKSPLPKPKGGLFDSLAAELRAKLNGNGPPLLLPPRDYDTVHRSKGNLAAIELRRCQNTMIVGATNNGSAKQVSSRGSSGIGSDLAPSPERQDDRTSSEEDNWSNEADNSIDALKTSHIRHSLVKRYCEDVDEVHKDNYLRDLPSKNNRPKYINKETNHNYKTDWSKEDDIRPKIVRPTHKNWEIENNRHRKIREDDEQQRITDNFSEEYERKDVPFSRGKLLAQRQQRESYEEEYEIEKDSPEHKQNLTDRQKYQKSTSYNKKIEVRGVRKYNEMKTAENQEVRAKANRTTTPHYYPSPERERPKSADRYRPMVVEEDMYPHEYERNPYKEPESLPYRQSIEKMLKSPIMRYKSFDDSQGYKRDIIDDNNISKTELRRSHFRDENYPLHPDEYHDTDRSYIPIQRKHPEHQETGLKVSFKERFLEAKEKFRAMEKNKYSQPEQQIISQQNFHDLSPYSKDHHVLQHSESDVRCDNWSDEERHINRNVRGPVRNFRRIDKRSDDLQLQPQIVSSKSLSNLVKGYRHSYAEPRPALPRSSGRVGLAAVNPF